MSAASEIVADADDGGSSIRASLAGMHPPGERVNLAAAVFSRPDDAREKTRHVRRFLFEHAEPGKPDRPYERRQRRLAQSHIRRM